MRSRLRTTLAGVCGGVLLVWGELAQAGVPRFCDMPVRLSTEQQSKLYRVAALVKQTLDRSGHRVALVSRSGLNLDRWGVRYSHAGFSLRDSPNGPWSVRQLYYACDEGKPRVFDQGMSGFLLGMDSPDSGYLSLVLLPEAVQESVIQTVLDSRKALQVLGPVYSANAYAYSVQYQNCNQWVAEVLALSQAEEEVSQHPQPRLAAQQWLQRQGYVPTTVDVGGAFMVWATDLIPWLHRDDHPAEALAQAHFQVSMPAAIEAFVQRTVAGAERIEVCHVGSKVVVHRGWTPMAQGCEAQPGDEVLELTP